MPPFDKLAVVTENIAAREAEIGLYEINIFNYEAMLASLVEPLDDDMRAYRARLVDLLASEKREKTRSELVYQALLSQHASLTAAS